MPSTDPDPVLRRRPRSQPLKITYEIHYVDGEAGRHLARRQAEVLRELLAQVAANRQHADVPEPTSTDDPVLAAQPARPDADPAPTPPGP